MQVSVPLFGDSFFMVCFFTNANNCAHCLRPLIRGFFFYSNDFYMMGEFEISFRPLIRGFFFYKLVKKGSEFVVTAVSVPLFGDSFFIKPVVD